ncbi:hypothetical protein SeLEV6574_g02402 [Synchytrium endobioticum]|nr:hypothetical protein SeLEV6574_g02402 [Synchytrium endobioticum]
MQRKSPPNQLGQFQKFRTQGYNGYAVEFTPFFENKIAVATAANFGIVGNGRLWILSLDAPVPGGIAVEAAYDSQDGLFDCAWSELNENQLVTSSGDGSIKLWDCTLPDHPVRSWMEHTREIFCVKWNLVRKDVFCSGSWDHTIKLWNPEMSTSLATFQEHTHCIYNTVWSPTSPDVFASCSGDHTVKTWDMRHPASTQTIRAHQNEVLALDWNKYRDGVVVTGSVDHTVKVWDLRFPNREVISLPGHEYAVRRLKCSPHDASLIASASYDMTVRIWDTLKPDNHLAHVMDQHTEFVLGIDWSLYIPGQIATAAWDESVMICRDLPLMR